RRRHTRSTRDWSSDVCSSDLDREAAPEHENKRGADDQRAEKNFWKTRRVRKERDRIQPPWNSSEIDHRNKQYPHEIMDRFQKDKIGRASCRERVKKKEIDEPG